MSDQGAFTLPDLRARRRLLYRVEAAGLDHITVGDHIGFHGGTGFDGLITASTLLASHESLRVIVGVYLLGLRHPMLAGRQLSTLAQAAPGRLTLGIGVAGEDRREVSNAGVDPGTRGLAPPPGAAAGPPVPAGEEVSHQGEFFTLEEARILPPPQPEIPMVIGGKGDAAIRRTAAFGDGWLGQSCSARRFAETRAQILTAAADRAAQPRRGSASTSGAAWTPMLDAPATSWPPRWNASTACRTRVSYPAPAGTPKQVAGFLRPFTEAGAGTSRSSRRARPSRPGSTRSRKSGSICRHPYLV